MDAKYMKESRRETLIMQDIQRLFNNDMKKWSTCQHLKYWRDPSSTPRSSTPKPHCQRPEISAADAHFENNSYVKFCQKLETNMAPKLRGSNGTFLTMNGFISGNLVMPLNQGNGPKITENKDDLRMNIANLRLDQDKKMTYIPSSKKIIETAAKLFEKPNFECRNGFRNCTQC